MFAQKGSLPERWHRLAAEAANTAIGAATESTTALRSAVTPMANSIVVAHAGAPAQTAAARLPGEKPSNVTP